MKALFIFVVSVALIFWLTYWLLTFADLLSAWMLKNHPTISAGVGIGIIVSAILCFYLAHKNETP